MPIALAVDFGGTKVEAALVDDTGRVLSGTRFRQPTGPTSSSDQLAASVDTVIAQVLATVPAGETIVGAGIGAAGPIDVTHGRVSPLNVPAWRDYPLLEQVQAAWAMFRPGCAWMASASPLPNTGSGPPRATTTSWA